MSTTATKPAWEVVGRPFGENEHGKNKGHLLIELRSPDGRVGPVARVAYERTEAHYKDISYEDQVDAEVAKALKTIEAINTLTEHAERLS